MNAKRPKPNPHPDCMTPEQKAIRSAFEAIEILRASIAQLAEQANVGHLAMRQLNEKLHEVDAIVAAPVSRQNRPTSPPPPRIAK